MEITLGLWTPVVECISMHDVGYYVKPGCVQLLYFIWFVTRDTTSEQAGEEPIPTTKQALHYLDCTFRTRLVGELSTLHILQHLPLPLIGPENINIGSRSVMNNYVNLKLKLSCFMVSNMHFTCIWLRCHVLSVEPLPRSNLILNMFYSLNKMSQF